MEDHLKNTERLEQEWTALCNYTPDQCDMEAGKLNPTRNRYPSILPCKMLAHSVVQYCSFKCSIVGYIPEIGGLKG